MGRHFELDCSPWRGVSGRLESLEARAGSEDAARPSDDEDGVTAVVLPVSVESPIRVSRLSEEGGSSNSAEVLESDIVVESGVSGWLGPHQTHRLPTSW